MVKSLAEFKVEAGYAPAGDQPAAIEALCSQILAGAYQPIAAAAEVGNFAPGAKTPAVTTIEIGPGGMLGFIIGPRIPGGER